MTTITVSSPEQQKGGISLGRQGEYGVREVVFSLSDYISEYGEGTAVLVHKLCDCADPYLVPVEDQGTFDYVERVDDTLIWHIGQMATYKKGYGQIELFWYVDGALKKSVIFGTSVAKSLEYDETRSLNVQKTYLDSISKVLAKSIENAADILRELDEADRLYNLAIGAAESIATLTVSSETVAPDVPANVERQVGPENQVNLHFSIPRGEKGETGSSAPFVIKFIPPHYNIVRDPNDPWDPGTLVEVSISVDKTFAEFEEAYQAGAPIYAYYDETPLALAKYSAGEYARFTQRIIRVFDDAVTFITDELQLNADDTISSQSFPQTFSKDQVFTIQFSKNGTSYQSDKTYSEIVNAYAAGKILIAEYDGTRFYLRTHSENDGYEFASVGITPTERSVFGDTCFVIYPNNDVDYIHRELTIAPPLIGSSVNTTPTDVINALAAGSPVALTFADSVYGNIVFTDFSHIANRGMVTSELFFVQNGQYNLIQLYGTTANSRWATNRTILTDLEALNRKLDAPSSSGTSGQILGLDEHLRPVWVDPATGGDDLYVVNYTPGDPYPNTTDILTAFLAGKAVSAHIIDEDGNAHILPLTTIEWTNGALESIVFSGGGWSFEWMRIMSSGTWILHQPLPSIDAVTYYIFRATYDSQTDSYTVTSAPTLEELWETARGQRSAIIATLYLDNGAEVYVGSDVQFYEVENDSPGSCAVSLAPGDIGFYQLSGTSSGWQMRLVLFTDVTALVAPATPGTEGQVLGLDRNLSPVWINQSGGSSIELDDTLSQSGKAADAAAVGTALAGKGTYSKPSGGIPKSDLASDVQTSLGKADTAVQTETDPTVPSWAKSPAKPSYSYSEITGTPTLAAVATSGSYSDLSNTPTIPSLTGYQTEAITDTGGYFTTDTVEDALQEIGAELAGINTLIGSGVIT